MKNMWSYSSVQEQKKSVLKQSLKAQCMLGIGLSPIKKIFPVQQQQLMSTDTAGYSTAYILRFQKPFNHTGTQITYARTKLFPFLVKALVSSLHPYSAFTQTIIFHSIRKPRTRQGIKKLL